VDGSWTVMSRFFFGLHLLCCFLNVTGVQYGKYFFDLIRDSVFVLENGARGDTAVSRRGDATKCRCLTCFTTKLMSSTVVLQAVQS
jgi:hypothetical protein